jgi:alkylhydroperoxidase family enzyme
VDEYQTSDAYSELEKLVLQYIDELVLRSETSEPLFSKLKELLSERELVELNLTIGFGLMTNLFTKSLMLP